MGEKPLVSVIMRLYNRTDYLAEAIESVLWQTYKNWELIIVDDGSTDNPEPLIEYYKNLDKRIKYYKKKHTGIADTGNYGIKKSKGDIICQADSDDIQLPNKIELTVKALEKSDYCYGSYNHCNTDAVPWEEIKAEPLTEERIINATAMCGETISYWKYVWEKVPYRKDFVINDDMAFVIDLYKSGFKYSIINEPTVNYRMLADGTSYSMKKEVDKLTCKILKEELGVKNPKKYLKE